MAKIVCESCETIFQYDVVKDMKVCPVCGKPLWEDAKDNENADSSQEVPSFGEGIKLGENDSFDEDKIDFWWYEVEKYNDGDVDIDATCTNCGTLISFIYPPVAIKDEYVLLDYRETSKCRCCGKELKNHILSKRPADWVDPRKRGMWAKDYENVPKCPICSSTRIHKISMTNKAASALAFGMLAAGHVSKTFKCDTCGAEF